MFQFLDKDRHGSRQYAGQEDGFKVHAGITEFVVDQLDRLYNQRWNSTTICVTMLKHFKSLLDECNE